jgi:branched-chain amino acid transport system permease protein
VSADSLVQVLVSGLAVGGIYVLIAQGFYITWRTSVTLNFGQGDFLMFGAFVALAFLRAGLPVAVAALLVAACLALLGALVERVAIRPVMQAGHGALTWAFTTLGVGVIIQNTVITVWGNSSQNFPPLLGGKLEILRLGGVGIYAAEAMIIVLSTVIMLAYLWVLRRTLFGKALAAVAFSGETAALLGINVRRMHMLAYVMASVLAGLCGVLVGPISVVHPFIGLNFALKGTAAAILGGFSSPLGIWVGGLLLGVIELGSNLVSSQFGDLYPFLVIVLVLVFRPSGLFHGRGADVDAGR